MNKTDFIFRHIMHHLEVYINDLQLDSEELCYNDYKDIRFKNFESDLTFELHISSIKRLPYNIYNSQGELLNGYIKEGKYNYEIGDIKLLKVFDWDKEEYIEYDNKELEIMLFNVKNL